MALLSDNFQVFTTVSSSWKNALIGPSTDHCPGTQFPRVRFVFCYLLKTIQKEHRSDLISSAPDERDRMAILAYIETIFEEDNDLILSTFDGGQAPPYKPDGTAHHTLSEAIKSLGLKLELGTDVDTPAMLNAYAAENVSDFMGRFASAQFTFLCGLAKKGDMTTDFAKRLQRTLAQNTMSLDIEIYNREVNWLTSFIIRRAKFDDDDAWKRIFHNIHSGAGDSERVRTLVEWATKVGITKMLLVKDAYTKFPDFYWKLVDEQFPGQTVYAHRVFETHKETPYRAFYSGGDADDWPVSRFNQVAKIAHTLLLSDGENSLRGYDGVKSVTLRNQVKWEEIIREYLSDSATKAFSGYKDKKGYTDGVTLFDVAAPNPANP